VSHNINNSALTCISLARFLRQKSVGWDRNFVHGWSDTIATAPPDGKRRSTNKELWRNRGTEIWTIKYLRATTAARRALLSAAEQHCCRLTMSRVA